MQSSTPRCTNGLLRSKSASSLSSNKCHQQQQQQADDDTYKPQPVVISKPVFCRDLSLGPNVRTTSHKRAQSAEEKKSVRELKKFLKNSSFNILLGESQQQGSKSDARATAAAAAEEPCTLGKKSTSCSAARGQRQLRRPHNLSQKATASSSSHLFSSSGNNVTSGFKTPHQRTASSSHHKPMTRFVLSDETFDLDDESLECEPEKKESKEDILNRLYRRKKRDRAALKRARAEKKKRQLRPAQREDSSPGLTIQVSAANAASGPAPSLQQKEYAACSGRGRKASAPELPALNLGNVQGPPQAGSRQPVFGTSNWEISLFGEEKCYTPHTIGLESPLFPGADAPSENLYLDTIVCHDFAPQGHQFDSKNENNQESHHAFFNNIKHDFSGASTNQASHHEFPALIEEQPPMFVSPSPKGNIIIESVHGSDSMNGYQQQKASMIH